MNNNYDKYLFRKEVQELNKNTIKSIADSYIWIDITYDALNKVNPQNLIFFSGNKVKKRKDFSESLELAKKIELYYSTYVYLYSKLEDFFVKYFELINKYDPNKIEYKDIKMFSNYDMKKQISVLNDNVILDVPEITMIKFNFMRNLRNIIIHNGGYVDSKFVENTDFQFNYNVGERIYLNKNYEFIVKEMKGIVGVLVCCVKKKYNLPSSDEYRKHFGINNYVEKNQI